jgi:hypothetical protein
MVERRNEISGGHFNGPVVQAGSIDQLTVHLSDPIAAQVRPLTSWRDRPELTPPLRDLLEAQHRATESLPYKLLRVKQPELTQVYVQQTMRPQIIDRLPESERKTAAETGERTLAVTEALNRNGHLMITGEPGGGKSTVGYMYVQQISEFWLSASDGSSLLTEPVLPLRIPARALAENKAWAELLASGAEDTLGRLLSERPRAELFARRALGARWLVFIDGLDEIVESDTRAQVIDAIAYQVRRNPDHRLVITTRPLPASELKPLEQAGVDTYAIQPFGPLELKEFARAWFRAQNPITAAACAEEFIRQVHDGRVRELVRNPLLATIAAIANTLEPHRQLPNSRVDLYGRFMEYLLDDGASRRNTVAELRRSLRDHPERLALVEWMHQHRTEIVERLAVHRLEAESPLFEAACEWVQANHSEVPDGWQADLRALLAGTGVFIQTEDNLRFRHHSFAEFLAARRRAGEIPADFPDLDEWIKRGLTDANQAFALFTFVLWGRGDHDLGQVLQLLLAGTKDKVMLAGRLLAEGISVEGELVTMVVDRIVDLLLSNGALSDPWDEVEEIGQVLVSFMPESLGLSVITRLHQQRDRPELAEATRIECAIVLGHLIEPESAALWLERFAENAGPAAVRRSVSALKDLVPNGTERAERLLVGMAAATEQDCVMTMALISMLLEIGRTEAAGPLVRGLVRRLRADPGVTGGGVLPLRARSSRIADMWEESSANWGVLAELAARSKCMDEALWAADKAFKVGDPSVEEFDDAVKAVLSVKGSDGLAEILVAVASKPLKHLIGTAGTLQEELYSKEAIELAGRAVAMPNIGTHDFYTAARVFVQAGATIELMRLIESSSHLGVSHRVQLASFLSDTKNSAVVEGWARSALVDHSVDRWDFSRAASALLGLDDPGTPQEIYQAACARGPEYQGRAAILLCGSGHTELGSDLIRNLLTEATETGTLVDVAVDLVPDREFALAGELLTAARLRILDCDAFDQQRLVDALARAGRRDEAIAAARRVVVDNISGYWLAHCVEEWIDVGGAASADGILTETLSRDVRAVQRMKIANEFAKAGLLAAAVTMWLDVVRHHGEAVDQGVAAASCLVKCGHRDQAIATLDDALTEERLTIPARATLRALRAWVTA